MSVKTTGRRVVTAQGIFNFVYRFIQKQGKPATTGVVCKYRMHDPDDGKILCCGVGCLLTDEEAKIADDNGDTSWCDVVRDGKAPERFAPFKALLVDIQIAHDDAGRWSPPDRFPRAFKKYMKEIAEQHGLEMPKL